MRVYRGFERLPAAARGAAVAIGNFDGVHRGHGAVIAAAAERARASGAELGVVTFEPHPREVLAPERAPRRLTPLPAKLRSLRDLGVGRAFVIPFDRTLMAMDAGAFARDVLGGALGAVAVAAGTAFRFGHRRSGDMDLLARLGAGLGFEAIPVPPVLDGGEPISSSRVRDALEAGAIEDAARLLGRPFALTGVVVMGDQRGRTIGFPTANVRPRGLRPALPAPGVYAVTAALPGGEAMPGVANLGYRPTFAGQDLRLEVHLLDRSPDLYGARLQVAFFARLRGETKFDGIEALKRQIGRDVEAARRCFASDRSSPI